MSYDETPTTIIIFGITGDLAQRYLLPALYHLIKENLLHPQTEIVGISRKDVPSTELMDKLAKSLMQTENEYDQNSIASMESRLHMIQMDPTDPGDYATLNAKLDDIDGRNGHPNRLFYLSIPPQVYGRVIEHMGEVGLAGDYKDTGRHTRLLVEKPFGFDLTSAQNLIEDTARVFDEHQVFRIDHYLAKETVQNILTFRFENPIFEALWNRDHIESIEISASEQIDIEGRAQFYDPIGALRDLIQNHLLQVLAITTMDQPSHLDSEHIHNSKKYLMEQITPVPADHIDDMTVRGQYEGYRDEVGNPDTNTETFAAVKLTIDNERWRDVPITIWTGKALDSRQAGVSIKFKGHGEHHNTLRFRIQPDEGIELDLRAKKPGFDAETQETTMDFSYQTSFGDHTHPNAYERVLVDAIRGDRTLFATSDEVLSAWHVVQPILNEWGKSPDTLRVYRKGAVGRDMVDWYHD